MKKLRLLLFEKCERNCSGCCNPQWDLELLPVETNFSGYDEILLTGGEPMLYPTIITETVTQIRKVNNKAKIYLYTAKIRSVADTRYILNFVDGITLTLYDQSDVRGFNLINEALKKNTLSKYRSYRLNIFKGIKINTIIWKGWKVKNEIVWIKDLCLPEGEIFKRLDPMINNLLSSV